MSKKWSVRIIQSGRVKIGGYWYVPSGCHLAYDGRLDGKRFAFGRYWLGDYCQPVVSLWGTEEAFRKGEGDFGDAEVDGALPWVWWKREETR